MIAILNDYNECYTEVERRSKASRYLLLFLYYMTNINKITGQKFNHF